MIKYLEPLFRPPAEHASLIFQVAYGCPHNSCRFCGMYKTVSYRQRNLNEVLTEIESAGRANSDVKRVFLADGDVMALPFEDLEAILAKLAERFPRLARVNVYANGSSILAKTPDQLRRLRELKLNTLYLGLETGNNDLLKNVNKKETVEGMIDAVRRAKNAGFKLSVMALLGLAGKNGSERHADLTANALNEMQPQLLSILRFIEVPGTTMHADYQTVTECEAVSELHRIIKGLELTRTVFRANHTSNPIPLEGRFPQDKERLIADVQRMLDSGTLDQSGPGATPFFL